MHSSINWTYIVYLSWSNVFEETGLFKSFITNNFWNFVRKIWLWVCHIFLSNNRLSCDKLNYVYTLFRRKNTKIIPLQSIKIGLTWIIFSSFSRYIVNILAGEEHWRFHKGEVTAYTQNIWYFQKKYFYMNTAFNQTIFAVIIQFIY